MILPGRHELDTMEEEARAAGEWVWRSGELFERRRSAARNLRELRRILRRIGPDVVHVQVPWAPVGWESILAARLSTRRVVRTEHNPIMQRLPAAQRVKMRILDALVDRIVCVSEGNRIRHVQNGGRPARKMRVIANGVAVGSASVTAGERDAIRRALGLGSDVPIAVMVGALERRKGPLEFVRAAARAATLCPSLQFVVIGEGPERAAMAALAAELGVADRLRLAGRRADVRRILPAFDIYVQASEYEGMSLAMLEALGAGLPMVSTRVDGVEDVLPSGSGVLLVDVGDVDGLAHGIAKLAADPEQRALLASVSQPRVRSRFTTEVMCDAYRSMYLEVVR